MDRIKTAVHLPMRHASRVRIHPFIIRVIRSVKRQSHLVLNDFLNSNLLMVTGTNFLKKRWPYQYTITIFKKKNYKPYRRKQPQTEKWPKSAGLPTNLVKRLWKDFLLIPFFESLWDCTLDSFNNFDNLIIK